MKRSSLMDLLDAGLVIEEQVRRFFRNDARYLQGMKLNIFVWNEARYLCV